MNGHRVCTVKATEVTLVTIDNHGSKRSDDSHGTEVAKVTLVTVATEVNIKTVTKAAMAKVTTVIM
jgi:hypothetical protein